MFVIHSRLLLGAILCSSTLSLQANTLCMVVGVTDGDTLTCLTATHQRLKIRLSHIDAPEKNQAFGQRAKATLASLAYRQRVALQINGQDRYGRMLAEVYRDGRNLNLMMVSLGMAWAYRSHQTPLPYRQQQARAQMQKLGLWRQSAPIYPGDYRQQVKTRSDYVRLY